MFGIKCTGGENRTRAGVSRDSSGVLYLTRDQPLNEVGFLLWRTVKKVKNEQNNSMKAITILCLAIVLLVGCRTPGHVSESDPAKLSIGMTKAELIKKIGKPDTARTEGNTETLGYTIDRSWWRSGHFQVKIVSGKVDSYGVER